MQNIASKAFIVLAAAGIPDAVYTAYEYTSSHFTCSATGTFCCACVQASGDTSIAGIPFWVTGLVWFPMLLALGLYLTKGGTWRLRGEILLPILMIGNLFTVYLWYLELAKIGFICPWCVSLYSVNYVLTALVAYDLLS